MNITASVYGVEVEIEFDYTEGEPTVMYEKNGDPGHPGCDPEVDLLEVTVGGQDLLEHLDDKFLDQCKQACIDAIEEDDCE